LRYLLVLPRADFVVTDLEWKLTYVGSATSNEHDQELDSVLVGPVPVGINKFNFRADPPDLSRIPNSEIIGVTVILLSCSYDEREFVRVGYYVNNEYTDEALALEPPAKPVIEKVRRSILSEKPRVTRFAIKWYDSHEISLPGQLLTSAGIPRRALPQSSPLTSLRPTLLRMATSTVPRKRRKRRPKPKLRLLLPLAARMPRWPVLKILLDLPWTRTLFRRLEARRSTLKRARTRMKMRKREKRRAVTTWKWTKLVLPMVIRVTLSSPSPLPRM
jgi:hypothetical protein